MFIFELKKTTFIVLLFNIYSDLFFLPPVFHNHSWLLQESKWVWSHAHRHTESNSTITDRWRQMDCSAAQTEKSFGQTSSPGMCPYNRNEKEKDIKSRAATISWSKWCCRQHRLRVNASCNCYYRSQNNKITLFPLQAYLHLYCRNILYVASMRRVVVMLRCRWHSPATSLFLLLPQRYQGASPHPTQPSTTTPLLR